MKKILSIVLVAAMLITTLVVSVSAAAWDGTTVSASLKGEGTAASPYLVESAADLAFLAKSVNEGTDYAGKYITQTADIDLGGKEWTPIGVKATPFKGVYDGKNYKIEGLSITKDQVAVGLFGAIFSSDTASAGVANLNLFGKITIDAPASDAIIGGLVGYSYDNNNAMLANYIYYINCTVDVDIKVTNVTRQPRLGGFAGYAFCTNFESCVNNGDIITSNASANTRVGGFVGQSNRTSYTNCVNNGKVESSGSAGSIAAAGFIGMLTDHKDNVANKVVITNCVNNGAVTATSTAPAGTVYAGGFTASVYKYGASLNAEIVNSVNNGKITGKLPTTEEGYTGKAYPYTGGFTAMCSYANFNITGSVNTAEIVSEGGAGARAGGIVGVMNNAAATDLFIKNCMTVGKLAAYIKNGTEGCVGDAEAAAVTAAAKVITDKLAPSTTDIAGFKTGYVAPVTPTPTPNPGTGDATVAVVLLATVALFGIGLVTKKVSAR